MLTSQGANAAGEQQRQWMFLKQDSLTEASLSPPIIIHQWVNDPSASGGSATVVEGRIAIIHRSMITRHRAVQGAAAVVVILVPALASRFAWMSRDTLNLDSELLHEIKIWALVIGRFAQPTFCFECPVYTALGVLAHGRKGLLPN